MIVCNLFLALEFDMNYVQLICKHRISNCIPRWTPGILGTVTITIRNAVFLFIIVIIVVFALVLTVIVIAKSDDKLVILVVVVVVVVVVVIIIAFFFVAC